MKKSDQMIIASFDDKDLIVDFDLWDYLLGSERLYNDSAISKDCCKCAFYIRNVLFEAVVQYKCNEIVVKCIDLFGCRQFPELDHMFMRWNYEQDEFPSPDIDDCSDMYVERKEDGFGNYHYFYFHTDPDCFE